MWSEWSPIRRKVLETPQFIFIRKSRNLFWLVPYRKGINEKQLLRIIITTVASVAVDMVWGYRNVNSKEMPYSTSIRKVVEYANEHHRFWELIDDRFFSPDDFEEKCANGPTMGEAVELAAHALHWKKLVDV